MTITAPPTPAPLFRAHATDGARIPFWTEREARDVATVVAAITGDVVAVETLNPSGAWVLVDLIGARP